MHRNRHKHYLFDLLVTLLLISGIQNIHRDREIICTHGGCVAAMILNGTPTFHNRDNKTRVEFDRIDNKTLTYTFRSFTLSSHKFQLRAASKFLYL